MRNLIYAINLSIDGCCDHNIVGAEGITDDLSAYYTDLMRDVDLSVFGRKTYDLMIPYWPDVAKDPSASKSDRDFAQAFTAMDKVVFSRSLAQAEANTRIARSSPGDELVRLKKEKGKKISVGGVDVAEQLIALGLVDEFYFFIMPVIVGEGRRLLKGTHLPGKQSLVLAGSKTFDSGATVLHYEKR